MDKQESQYFERIIHTLGEIAKAERRIADAVDKQNPGRASQILSMAAAGAAALGVINIIDTIRDWIMGG